MTAVSTHQSSAKNADIANCRWALTALWLMIAVLFLKPQELMPALQGVRLYAAIAVFCILLNYNVVVGLFSSQSLHCVPVTVCLLGMQIGILLSHLTNGSWGAAFTSGIDFSELLAYYLILLATIQTLPQLLSLLEWIGGLIVVTTVLSLAFFFQVLSIPGILAVERERHLIAATGDSRFVDRFQSFNSLGDPNVFGVVLAVGIILCLHSLFRCNGLKRVAWGGGGAMLLAGLYLTHSRTGFLALVGSLGTYGVFRFGWLRTLGAASCGALFLLPRAGRMAEVANAFEHGGTGAARLYLARYSVDYFQAAPIFGIGEGEFQRRIGWVVHNSFLECFAELGIVGGTSFLGVFWFSCLPFLSRFSEPSECVSRDWTDVRACLIGLLTAVLLGALALSLHLVQYLYLIIGLVAIYTRLSHPRRSPSVYSASRWAVLMVLSGVFLVISNLVVVYLVPALPSEMY